MDKNIGIHKLISRFKLDCSIKVKDGRERKFHYGYEYVDLGLPSGTLWATCNVGAESETYYGNYYMYGYGSKVYSIHDIFYDGKETPLDQNADTATQAWGGKWHMPTKEQIEELIRNTTYQWVYDYKNSGVNGGLFTSNINGKSVFFPACGYWSNDSPTNIGYSGRYWSSSPNEGYAAYFLYFSSDCDSISYFYRYLGYAVRPVIG